MSNPIKNGRKPLSSKPQSNTPFTHDDVFGNKLNVPDNIRQDIEEKGHEFRWVDAKQLAANGGYHERGWMAYSKKKDASIDSQEFLYGASPDGTLRRGSVILATRPKELGDKHRLHLRLKSERQSSVNKQKAKELKQLAASSQIDMQVHEGYEENE